MSYTAKRSFVSLASTNSYCGFLGSPAVKVENNDKDHYPHLAMTYSALASLLVLGDDFSNVDKNGIIKSLRYLQKMDGR